MGHRRSSLARFRLGQVQLPPSSKCWAKDICVGDKHHVVFPQTAVLIRQRGIEILADPNSVVLYDADESYSRTLVDPRGDRCFFAALDERLVDDMSTDLPRRSRRPSFPDVAVPVDAQIYALQWRTVRNCEAGAMDGLVVDEGILAVLSWVIGRASEAKHTGSGNGQRRILERTKRLLSETLNEPLSLSEIAALVHVSPYHLTRLFRRYTGMPLHSYRTQLRLRSSLGRLEWSRETLRDVATSLGFSSHSHFSARFRRAFGCTPTQWRRADPNLLCTLCSGIFDAQ